jgi:hypothetical protein
VESGRGRELGAPARHVMIDWLAGSQQTDAALSLSLSLSLSLWPARLALPSAPTFRDSAKALLHPRESSTHCWFQGDLEARISYGVDRNLRPGDWKNPRSMACYSRNFYFFVLELREIGGFFGITPYRLH